METDKQRIAGLVAEIQNGNQSAFDELYKLTSERAYFVALEFTKNNQDAEDILQESYIKALSKIKELDKPESFSSWLNQIVANKSKDFLKKKKPMLFEAEENEVFEVLPDEDTNFQPEDNLDQTELQKTVMEVLDELSEEKRACVLMMYFEELSVGEIAQTLEIPEGTVKTRLFSARKELKEKFARRGITSTFSVAPIGVVIWALRRISEEASGRFIASGASAKVLSGISVAGTGTAVAGTTAASVAGTSTAAVTSAATTGTGIAAKIAAMTVVQKVVAGVSVAAVVTGSTVGTVTVVNSNKNKNTELTVHTEEYTTAPSFETTLAVDALGTVEFSESTELTALSSVADNSSSTKNPTANLQSTNTKATSTSSKQTTTAKQSATTQKQTTTKKATTTKKSTTTTKKSTTTTKKSTTTTKKSTTTTKKSTTTTKKPTTTTKKPTTTTKKSTTTTQKPTTTTQKSTTTTTKKVTTTVKPTTTTRKQTTTVSSEESTKITIPNNMQILTLPNEDGPVINTLPDSMFV